LLGLLTGYLASYLVTAKYTAEATILVEPPILPVGVAPRLSDGDTPDEVLLLRQQISSPRILRPIIERLALARPGDDIEELISEIQTNLQIIPVPMSVYRNDNNQLSAFDVQYTSRDRELAARLCNELTSAFLAAHLEGVHANLNSLREFVGRQVDRARSSLLELDIRLREPNQQRASLTPNADAQHRMLIRDVTFAEKRYEELQRELSRVQLAIDAQNTEMAGAWKLGSLANKPDEPTHPNRWLFARIGLGIGLLLGIALAVRSWWRSRSVQPGMTVA
jgi:uncharacterized protein involved in exopolysaccharide biosynthesis